MRIARFIGTDDKPRYGLDRGDGSAELLPDTPLPQPDQPTGQVVSMGRRLAPIQPTNIICIGANYLNHIKETGGTAPDNPVLFMKPTSALNHPDGEIVIPACQMKGPEVDSEAELAVVIGKPAKNVSEAEALEYVLGYTCANDVSARRWQKHGGGGQWVRGKSFDSFCPLGPVIVTAGDDEESIADPQQLAVTAHINGQPMQSGHSSDMLFSVAHIIAFVSRDTTLLPGTVLLTGTPSGVGVARDPQVFLQPGDEVAVNIERIGELRNTVVAAG